MAFFDAMGNAMCRLIATLDSNKPAAQYPAVIAASEIVGALDLASPSSEVQAASPVASTLTLNLCGASGELARAAQILLDAHVCLAPVTLALPVVFHADRNTHSSDCVTNSSYNASVDNSSSSSLSSAHPTTNRYL